MAITYISEIPKIPTQMAGQMEQTNSLRGATSSATQSATGDIAIPKQLEVHLRHGQLVLFAGAGLSAQAGLPLWRSLMQDVIRHTLQETMQAEEAELTHMLGAGKWLQIADHCKEKLGPGGYARLLTERLSDAGVEVPEVHRIAVRLPFAAWITTNYDKLIERAYTKERGDLPKTLTHMDTEPLGRFLFDGVHFVLKAHGDLDKPDSLVFTSRDYRDLIHGNTAFSTAFSAILLTHAVLFVGYSLSDPDFNLLLDRQLLTFRGFVPERYALMSDIGKVEEEYLWRVCRVRVIRYPDGRHESIRRFFEQLAERFSAEEKCADSGSEQVINTASLQTSRGFASAGQRLPDQTTPLVLSLEWSDRACRTTLMDGEVSLASQSTSTDRWPELAAASRALTSEKRRAGKFDAFSALCREVMGSATIQQLANVLRNDEGRLVRLELSRQIERIPWELVAINSRTLGEQAAVFRAPVDMSESARGLPAIRHPLRVLVVADTTAAGVADAGLAPLPGAAQEAKEIAALFRKGSCGTVEVLLGPEATYEAVGAAFERLQPDIFHFAGHAWFDDREAYLNLADGNLMATMLRPWLTRHSPALVFLNSHYTAFIPAGVETTQETGHTEMIRAGLGGRTGFSELAMRTGVGAFLGSIGGNVSDEGGRDFALALYRSLLKGTTVAEAVLLARQGVDATADITGLLYCVYGAGGLRVVPAGAI